MRKSSRTAITALAVVIPVLTPGVVAAAPASGASAVNFNCRQVIANDITFFLNSTGGTRGVPVQVVCG